MSEALDEVARQMVDVVRVLKSLHEEATREIGLRLEMPGMGVLAQVERGGPARLSAVADELRLDLSTVSRQVASLERAGLLARSRDPLDSRASLLDLTATGRQTIDAVRGARIAAMARRLPDWDEAELSELAGLLSRFTRDLRAELPLELSR
ncbi:MAG: MarR family transcriptional regulator [Mycobacteriales bacterium]|nr:MarR family transcriptional regulator [Mycobacteriales bacterium]